MARKRQIDPEYPFKQEIAQLSVPARYFYIMSWCHMDDVTAVMPRNAYKLKGQIFPNDDVDVEALIEELIGAGRLIPFEADNRKWLWCPTLLKHQVINHPSRKRYPEPPKELREDYRSGKVGLPQSRVEGVEKSRVEKEQPEADKLLNQVYKEGLNIYQLINKLKKQMKWKKKQRFPADIRIAVCRQYFKDKANIKSEWGWFSKVIQAECAAYFARESMKEREKWKKMPVAISMKQIMEGMK